MKIHYMNPYTSCIVFIIVIKKKNWFQFNLKTLAHYELDKQLQ